MAQKRMIDKKISVSEQVANLPLEGQIIFTWAVPHADDLGLLPFSHRTLKALVVPMMELTLEDFGNHVEAIVSQGLWEVFTHEKDTYYRIPKFTEHQTLKKDRKPNTYLFGIESWEQAVDLGFHLEDSGNPREEKGREVKGREEKPHKHIEFLRNIPQDVLKELTEKYEASSTQIKRKCEELVNYCAAKGKTYKDYRAFLENALDKDFGRRVRTQPKAEEPKKTLTPEEQGRVDKIKQEINQKMKAPLA